MKPVILVLGLTLLVAVGLIFGLPYLNQATSKGKMEISPKEYDLGTISMAQGVVSRTFEVKNVGQEDLEIDNIWTSCHCTTAVLKVGAKESPRFGMDNNSPFWSQKITPGETGLLEVFFDPASHGSAGLGPAVRAVYLLTSDPNNKTAEVRLNSQVIQ